MPISKKEIQRHWTEKEVQMQNIIKNRDWNALFSMDENDDFSWTLEQILQSFVTKSVNGTLDLSNLTHTQKVLFLVLEVESATQADALPNFLKKVLRFMAVKRYKHQKKQEHLNVLSFLMQQQILCQTVFTQKEIKNFGILLCQEKILKYGIRQVVFQWIIRMEGFLICAVLMQRHIEIWFIQADGFPFIRDFRLLGECLFGKYSFVSL